MTITIRHAAPSDLASIQAISDAAYGVYVAAMGQKPGPMLADYGAHLADDAVLVAVAADSWIGRTVLGENMPSGCEGQGWTGR